MKIRTIAGAFAVATVATLSLATPALAGGGESSAPPSGSPTASAPASATPSTPVPTSAAATTAAPGQQQNGAGGQVCQNQAGKVIGNQVCVNVNGTFVLAVKPAECGGATTCNAEFVEVPAVTPCEDGQKFTLPINGEKRECTCKKSNGATVLQVRRVAVTKSEAGALAVTGSNTTTIALVGGGVLLAGAGIVVAARRRRNVRFQA